MLKFTLTLMSLLPLMNYNISWITTACFLLILSLMMSMNLTMDSSFTIISPISSMDSMSATLLILTMWITALMLMASFKIKYSKLMHKMFYLTILLLAIILVFSFSSSNMIMFYVWFEASLIPTMILIMMWGYQPERVQASMYLMMYTVTASLPLLIIILMIYSSSNSLMMPMFWAMSLPLELNQNITWIMLISAFLVKLPLFSVHLWLPKAHVEAPIAGSMILAAILLKLGGYGLLRVIWIFNSTKNIFASPIMSISLIGAVLTSLICLRQSDMKSLIAYSSVGHMGILVAGAMSNSKFGLYGALGMMIAHGLTSSALFCMANISYELYHSRSMVLSKGMLSIIPSMSLMWFMFSCANMAAPPSINLLSEILLMTATSYFSLFMTLIFMFSSFLTAAYSLHLYANINHGPPILISNPLTGLKPLYMSMLILHLWPIIMLIMVPSSIIIWC